MVQSVEITAEQWMRHREAIVASKHLKYCRIRHSKEMDLQELFLLDTTVAIGLVFYQTIEAFPEELRGLRNLRYLHIDAYGFQVKIPPWFSEFQQLESLHLVSTESGEFPREILECHNLLDLSICTNFTDPLQEIPEDIGKLKNLETLNLKENNLRGLPDSLWTLSNLRELDLSLNRFSTISDEVLQLQQLKKLNLKFNPMNKENLRMLRSSLKRRLIY